MSVFDTLNNINVNDKTEKKNGLTYLSWAWAWGEVKKNFPDAKFTVYERISMEHGPINYFTDGRTCWVKTGLTINGLEHIEYLPVMDYRNNSIPLEKITSTDVNKAIQRSLTKAAARHGLGLYIYAGEDLPEGESQEAKAKEQEVVVPEMTRLQKKVEAQVERASTLPKITTEPAPTPPVIQFLLTAKRGLQEKRGIDAAANDKLFKAQHAVLVKAKLAPDKKADEYTMDEAAALIEAMEKCFDLTGTELKTE